ncbi:manganese efflux pump MntP family protein [Bacillus horti]|uniref:Putative manganese efflux pump MntP n=1 Tax=Caldalkalibacillus horti TaxID=77523 RepID=A0ABT9VVZ1_9BACI|nr:manganese efflux pump MntP family protein [Bacillus horti]MDQ0165146.1 putative Mn2+ efflux pump MntP [Bacillus horti]
MDTIDLGEILTLSLVAIALSMDSFSVSIGLGMQRMRLRHMLKISVINGLFHVVMPLAGMVIGKYLSSHMGHLAVTVGGILLLLFGLHMIYSAIFGEEQQHPIGTHFMAIMLFSLGVSIDAFSVGLSFGLFSANIWLMLGLFGSFAALFTCLGLLVGRKVGDWLGSYSEMIGGLILLVFGLKFLV